MKTERFLLLITLVSLVFLLNSQVGINTNDPDQTLDVNGKIEVGFDNLPETAGSIRFNPSTSDFEGFDGTNWYSLTTKNDPGYVNFPSYNEYLFPGTMDYDLNLDGTFFFRIVFSESINPSTVSLGTTLLIEGTGPTNGNISWSANNTIMTFTSTTLFIDVFNGTTCSIPVTLKGSAGEYVKSIFGVNIDGDGDGASGGNLFFRLGSLC